MQAAVTAYELGHEVVLCEKKGQLGGALKFADNGADFKIPMRRYRDSQIKKVRSLPIDVRLNTAVDKSVVEEIAPDVMIVAIGADPIAPPIPGARGDNVVNVANINNDTPFGRRVVIIGGGLNGCEEALLLARGGHDVAVIEALEDWAPDIGIYARIGLDHELQECPNITMARGHRCTSITDSGVYAADSDANEKFFPCDTVVMAIGLRSRSEEANSLRALASECYVVGDALRPRKVMNAVRDGYDAAVDMGL
jgi:pyruvate/2-oxoglutarate dehydrogenase complex dihydrolipoamide dehydrogenase (E3) component